MHHGFHLYLVSDSTGETVSSVSRAALAQFEDVQPVEHVWSLVRTRAQIEQIVRAIEEEPGFVMYTLVEESLATLLRRECRRISAPCVPVLSRVVAEMEHYLGAPATGKMGRQHQLDEEYFERVEAVNYTLAHDDGQAHWDLEEADIILVGVSRTSKSPTCVYLAHRGYKAANVPWVPGCPLPPELTELEHPFIVGLVIDPDRLIEIRQARLQSLKSEKQTDYTDLEKIREEIKESRRLFSRQGWPVIDVTHRSVEETAATILQYYQQDQEKKKW